MDPIAKFDIHPDGVCMVNPGIVGRINTTIFPCATNTNSVPAGVRNGFEFRKIGVLPGVEEIETFRLPFAFGTPRVLTCVFGEDLCWRNGYAGWLGTFVGSHCRIHNLPHPLPDIARDETC